MCLGIPACHLPRNTNWEVAASGNDRWKGHHWKEKRLATGELKILQRPGSSRSCWLGDPSKSVGWVWNSWNFWRGSTTLAEDWCGSWTEKEVLHFVYCASRVLCGQHFWSARWARWGFSSLRFWMWTLIFRAACMCCIYSERNQHSTNYPRVTVEGNDQLAEWVAICIMHSQFRVWVNNCMYNCCESMLTCAWTAQMSGWEQQPHQHLWLLLRQGFQAWFCPGRSFPVDDSLELRVCSMRNEPALQQQRLLWFSLPDRDNVEADGNIWMVLCGEFYNKELKWHPALFLNQVSHFTRYSISLLSCIINWEAFPCGWCIFPPNDLLCECFIGGTLISFHHFARNPPKLLRKPKLLKDNWGVSLWAHHLCLLQE